MAYPQALLVFARQPVAGQVKMRMVNPFTPEESAALYRAFLQDSLARFVQVPETDVLLFLPPEEKELDAELLPAPLPMFPQQGRTMASRMLNAVRQVLTSGYQRCLLTGIDCPTLPLEFIQQGFRELLDKNSITVGPSMDGGFYLLGMNRIHEEVFEDMTYGHPHVFEETILRVSRTGARLVVLPQWYDVDTPEDLMRLAADLSISALDLPHTREVVAGLVERYPLLASIEAFANL